MRSHRHSDTPVPTSPAPEETPAPVNPASKRPQTAPSRTAFWISAALNLLLCVALVLLSVEFHAYRQSTVLAMETLLEEPAPADDSEEETASEPEEETISVASLQYYAQKHNVSIEFLQNFFPDAIVYKDSQGIVYSPIDPDLPKNDYDWDNLVRTDGRVEYRENGESTSYVGIDVSKYQGTIDWEQVGSDGVDYAIIRLGFRGYETGKIVLDETFHTNMQGALDAGLDVGVYFYTQAITEEEAREEAAFVLEHLEGYEITYPVIFDTEDPAASTARTNDLSQEELTDITIAFCDTIKEAGYTPMIYANIKWFVANLDLSRLTEYDKWFAQYFNQPFFPYEFQMWQYTSQGSVAGIAGNVDLNVCFADYGGDGEPADASEDSSSS